MKIVLNYLHANNVSVLVKTQHNINVIDENVVNHGKLSSVTFNRRKIEALAVGDRVSSRLVLPRGLVWKRVD